MRVTNLAKSLSITPETVRYYTRIGLLTPDRETNGYKEYSEGDRKRLDFIVHARHLGFSVADVEEILSKADSGEVPCPTVRRLIEERLAETEKRFEQMRLLRDRMRSAINQWDSMPNNIPCGDSICHLIEGLTESEELS